MSILKPGWVSKICTALTLCFFTSFPGDAFGQLFGTALSQADPIELAKQKMLKNAFEDTRFASGFLLTLNFFTLKPIEQKQNTSNKPKITQQLITYFSDACKEMNEEVAADYFDRGQARIDSNKFSEAMSDFDRSLIYSPKNSDTYVARAVLFIYSKQYREALEELEKAQKFNPKNAQVPFNRGVILFDQGDLKNATAQIDSSLSLNPQFGRAYFEKGLIQKAQGNIEGSIKSFKKARSLDDPDAGGLIRESKAVLKTRPKK